MTCNLSYRTIPTKWSLGNNVPKERLHIAKTSPDPQHQEEQCLYHTRGSTYLQIAHAKNFVREQLCCRAHEQFISRSTRTQEYTIISEQQLALLFSCLVVITCRFSSCCHTEAHKPLCYIVKIARFSTMERREGGGVLTCS
uniref:Uncharacterized protein n=1 Tax=Opuntia streptacantha TaxID=393608 RepID=A0A7C9CQY4_OPUST